MEADGKPSLDMANPKDRAMLHEAIRRWPKRWRGLTDEFKDELAASLRMANETAKELASKGDPETALEAIKMIPNIVRVGVAMEGQNQADEHLAEKNERIDTGKATENVGLIRVMKPDIMRPKD